MGSCENENVGLRWMQSAKRNEHRMSWFVEKLGMMFCAMDKSRGV